MPGKSKVQRSAWRTLESALNLLSFLVGWPRVAIAEQVLKSQKREFSTGFCDLVVVKSSVLGRLMSFNGEIGLVRSQLYR